MVLSSGSDDKSYPKNREAVFPQIPQIKRIFRRDCSIPILAKIAKRASMLYRHCKKDKSATKNTEITKRLSENLCDLCVLCGRKYSLQ
jgi:hypothetical protein